MWTRRIGFVAALGLLTGCASLGGPPPAVQGTVVDDSTGEALAGVMLLLEDGTHTRADRQGRYAFREVAPGPYRLLVVATGCRSGEGALTVPAAEDAPPVEVRVTLPPPERRPGEVPPPDESRGRVVTDVEIEEMGTTRLSEVVRRVAPEMIGAAGAPGQPSALRGRGVPSPSGARVPVLVVDGIVVHATDASALDQIAVRDVAWVEILPGAVSGWEYGTGGSGGVIRVQTKQGYRPGDDIAPEYCVLPEGWPTPEPGG